MRSKNFNSNKRNMFLPTKFFMHSTIYTRKSDIFTVSLIDFLHVTLLHESKGKGKGRFMGLYNTAAVRPIVFLPPTSSRIHFQRRHASYRCARPLPAKAGTITNEFCQQMRNSRKFTRFFYMPQSWDVGQILLLPLRRKAY